MNQRHLLLAVLTLCIFAIGTFSIPVEESFAETASPDLAADVNTPEEDDEPDANLVPLEPELTILPPEMIESTPDTIITLINGDTLIVRENVDEVVRRAIDYARQIRGFQVV